tara:strand:- start:174 stop:428 length:255 start_codon:yes stop_codon:yes gene_type:complete
MSEKIKEQEFKEKSLKLLADPCKLKDIQYNPKYSDSFKKELDYKFNCEVNDTIYNHIVQEINSLLVIDSVLQDIINQVSLDQTP